MFSSMHTIISKSMLYVLEVGIGIKGLKIHQYCIKNELIVFLYKRQSAIIKFMYAPNYKNLKWSVNSPQWAQPLVSALVEP